MTDETQKPTEYTNFEIKNLPESEVEITVEIPAETLEKHEPAVVTALGKDISLPGFRPGHAPEHMLRARIGEMKILEECLERALRTAYPQIVRDNNIAAIGDPNIAITKLAPGNPVGLTITVAVMPDIALPDYHKIAKEENVKPQEPATVEDKEIDEIITQIQKTKTGPTDSTDAGNQQPAAGSQPLTDEFVKTLGDFKDVDDFKSKIREDLQKTKERQAKEKRRLEIADAIIAQTKTDVPKLLVDSELANMLAQFKHDVARMGIPFDEYLKHIKKTEDDMRNEWKTDAEKRAKLHLILREIAKKENITPSPEQVEHETKHILSHQKGAPEERVRAYVASILSERAVFEFLENQK